jgi:2-(1,2-epoxy-1,2-dihydrophenyl)acetyl-CoA isomerase
MQDLSNPVLWRAQNGVGHIVLNRPDAANAIDLAMAEAFGQAVAHLANADIGAVLISANGRQFCAGGDIRTFHAELGRLDQLVRDLLDILHPALQRLVELPVPVITAIQGSVGGAGIGLALCADIALASEAMKLRGGYSALGLSPDLGASYFLAHRAGAARAKSILMTNRALSAAECLGFGLVDELHPASTLTSAAERLAMDLAAGATGALGGIKRLCDRATRLTLVEHLGDERRALLRCAQSADGREGVRAFAEKRAAVFSDPRID